jgi:hypothetical protein
MARGKRNADEQLLLALACGASDEQAALKSGLSVRTVYRRKAEPEFQRRIQALRADMMQRAGGILAAPASTLRIQCALPRRRCIRGLEIGEALAGVVLGRARRPVHRLSVWGWPRPQAPSTVYAPGRPARQKPRATHRTNGALPGHPAAERRLSPTSRTAATAAASAAGFAAAAVAFAAWAALGPANSSWSGAVTGRRWVAVGDAALAHDPLSGLGVSHALASGWHAARAIIGRGATWRCYCGGTG